MTLAELIAALEAADPTLVVPHGFTDPHSYRGYYEDLAFEPAENVTVGQMLADARSALGATFQGWKGGDYEMAEGTECWLATRGSLGETLGPMLLQHLLAAGEAGRQARAKIAAVYIAESIWFGDNPVDGRTRLATCLTLDEALGAIKAHGIFGEPALIATPCEPSALHGEGGRTWAVHPEGEEPNDEGHLWITEERIAPPL